MDRATPPARHRLGGDAGQTGSAALIRRRLASRPRASRTFGEIA